MRLPRVIRRRCFNAALALSRWFLAAADGAADIATIFMEPDDGQKHR